MKSGGRAKSFVEDLGDLFLIGLGLFALYTAASGVASGEVTLFSKRVDGFATLAAQPIFFWGTIAAWVLGGTFLLRIAVRSWRERRQ